MRRLLHYLLCIIATILHCGCGNLKYVPVQSQKEIKYVTKDSIIERIDTMFINLPSESHSQALKDTSSHLETSLATSDAMIDSNGILHHSLTNKDARLPLQTKVIERTKEVVRDSIVYQDKIVEVEVVKEVTPRWSYWSLIGNIITALLIGFGIYLKVRFRQ